MRSEFCFSRKALFHQVAPPQRSGLAVSLQSIGGENRFASQAGSATTRAVFIDTLQILDLTSTVSWRNSMPEQETHLSEPSPASAESPKCKYRKWTREEEQKLVDILCANPSWADTLYPHRKNSRPACYSKSGLTKQSAALIRPDDPPSKVTVLYKIESMERRYWHWRYRNVQAGLCCLIKSSAQKPTETRLSNAPMLTQQAAFRKRT